jgi:hypothetical protein
MFLLNYKSKKIIMKNENHDFNEPIEKTSVDIARLVLQNFTENFDIFIFENTKEETGEEKNANQEHMTDFGIKVLAYMATTDIPADYATYGIDKIIAALNAVKNYVDGSLRQAEDELMSRTLGAKSPVTNTYARDTATLGQLMLALKTARDLTGNKPEDYFIPKMAPVATPEVPVDSTETPVVPETPELSTETPVISETLE